MNIKDATKNKSSFECMPVEKDQFRIGKYKFQFGSGGAQSLESRRRAPGGGVRVVKLGGFSTGMFE